MEFHEFIEFAEKECLSSQERASRQIELLKKIELRKEILREHWEEVGLKPLRLKR
jgi:hypothetical protein